MSGRRKQDYYIYGKHLSASEENVYKILSYAAHLTRESKTLSTVNAMNFNIVVRYRAIESNSV